jgi:hypothetical protein
MPRDGELADSTVQLAGEVAGRSDADHADDLVAISGDENGPLRGSGKRIFQPAVRCRKHSS